MGLIFLCGLPGCGKTSIGKIVAQLTCSEFIDLDEVVEAIVGKTISSIFVEDGEDTFREYEQEALIRVCEREEAIIALGAGALENPGGVLLALASGKLIYLRRAPAEIAQRELNWAKRPLMAGASTQEQIADKLSNLLERREAHYLQAVIVIDVTQQDSPEQTAKKIVSELKLR